MVSGKLEDDGRGHCVLHTRLVVRLHAYKKRIERIKNKVCVYLLFLSFLSLHACPSCKTLSFPLLISYLIFVVLLLNSSSFPP